MDWYTHPNFRVTAAAPGLGDIVLDDVLDPGTVAPAETFPDQSPLDYLAETADHRQWERGRGTLRYGTGQALLKRAAIVESSNGGQRVNFTRPVTVYSPTAPHSPLAGVGTAAGGSSVTGLSRRILRCAFTADSQIVTLPDASTLSIGDRWVLVNQSGFTGAIRSQAGTTVWPQFLPDSEVVLMLRSNTSQAGVWLGYELGGGGIAIGTIIPLVIPTLPKRWAWCDGSVLSVATYPDLFRVLGSRFGGNGTTTFGLPRTCGRVLIGADAMGGTASGRMLGWEAVGTTGGSQYLPVHNHWGHLGTGTYTYPFTSNYQYQLPCSPVDMPTAGAGGFQNMQPCAVVPDIIFTGVYLP